ncbi:MAG: hypothetical protein AAGH64_10515, partial [Planctomycetota bacterium]
MRHPSSTPFTHAGTIIAICGLALAVSVNPMTAPASTVLETGLDAEGVSGETPSVLTTPPFGHDTLANGVRGVDEPVAQVLFSDDETTSVERGRTFEMLHDALHDGDDALPPVDFEGNTPFAETVRYVEDFEDRSVDRSEWAGLESRVFEGMTRVAGPFKTGGASVRIETKPGELYTVVFDLALIGARIGDPGISNHFTVVVDGQAILDTPIREFTAEAMATRESVDDPLITPRIQLFFRAEHPITTLAFEGVEQGEPGGEVWGVDNIVIDRVTMNPAEVEDPGYFPTFGGGGGG